MKFEKNEICYVFQKLLLYILLKENWVEININHKKIFFGLKMNLKKRFLQIVFRYKFIEKICEGLLRKKFFESKNRFWNWFRKILVMFCRNYYFMAIFIVYFRINWLKIGSEKSVFLMISNYDILKGWVKLFSQA